MGDDVILSEIERFLQEQHSCASTSLSVTGYHLQTNHYRCVHAADIILAELTLTDRTYICTRCGVMIDRDVNTAINLEMGIN